MTYSTKYTVRGGGTFPLDMLRYDRSFPATEEDTGWILRTDEREVMLAVISDGKTAHIERARWRSYNWVVTEVYAPQKM